MRFRTKPLTKRQVAGIQAHYMNMDSSFRLRDQLRAATHQVILDSAERVFERGIARARMEDIAAEAGVAVGTLYNHFADRQALLNAVIEARRTELSAAIAAAIMGTGKEPFPRRLESFMLAALELIRRHRGFFFAAWQWEEGGLPSPLRHSMLRELYAQAETLAREGMAAGYLTEGDAELYSIGIVGLIRGVTGAMAVGEIELPLKQLCVGLVRCFLEGAARK
jgi:AcrR family transcriptional regulator